LIGLLSGIRAQGPDAMKERDQSFLVQRLDHLVTTGHHTFPRHGNRRAVIEHVSRLHQAQWF
jgi:hypothetical protein